MAVPHSKRGTIKSRPYGHHIPKCSLIRLVLEFLTWERKEWTSTKETKVRHPVVRPAVAVARIADSFVFVTDMLPL